MRFRRLPRFSLRTLLLLTACVAAYLGGHLHGRKAAFYHWKESLHVYKSYPIADIMPARNDKDFEGVRSGLRWFIEESLNSGRGADDMALPAKVDHLDNERVGVSLPPRQVDDVDLLLAKLRQAKQAADSKGEPFEIPAPLRQRAQW